MRKKTLLEHTEWDAKEHKDLSLAISKIDLALFGDGNGNKGLLIKVDEMHKVFTSANWAVNFLVKLFGSIGVFFGAIYAFGKMFSWWK